MTTTLSPDDVAGQVLLPGESGYDAARRTWNAMVDHRPRMIVRCATVDDVRSAIAHARRHDLEVGVRCGGHSLVGHAVPDDGLMVDLTPLAAVDVDPVARRARVQGGALLRALDLASQEHGLATTAGNVSHTGVGGLTLGGGVGWLARLHGLACDNVVAFQVVTADGRVVRAAEDENPELWWGLRGGGGNFGVVTEFELRLHPVGTQALGVELDFPVEDARDAMRRWRDLSVDAPREATYEATVTAGVATIGFVWVGDPDAGRRHAYALRSLGTPAAERVDALSYLELQARDDSDQDHAVRRYWKSHYFRELTDAAIDELLDHDPTLAGNLQARGGAIAEVPDDATAFSHRDATFEYLAATRWTDPAEDAGRMALARQAAARMEPFSSGAYVNALGDEGASGVVRAYSPAKLARLTALKDAWDPDNVFHLNQNVPPSGR